MDNNIPINMGAGRTARIPDANGDGKLQRSEVLDRLRVNERPLLAPDKIKVEQALNYAGELDGVKVRDAIIAYERFTGERLQVVDVDEVHFSVELSEKELSDELGHQVRFLKSFAGDMVYHMKMKIASGRQVNEKVLNIKSEAEALLVKINEGIDAGKVCAMVSQMSELAAAAGFGRPEGLVQHYGKALDLIREMENRTAQKAAKEKADRLAGDPVFAKEEKEEREAAVKAAAEEVLVAAEKLRDEAKLELEKARNEAEAEQKRAREAVRDSRLEMKQMIRDLKFVSPQKINEAVDAIDNGDYMPARQALAEEFNRTVEENSEALKGAWRWEKAGKLKENEVAEAALRKKAARFKALTDRITSSQAELAGGPRISEINGRIMKLETKLEKARELAGEAYKLTKKAETYPAGAQELIADLLGKADELKARDVADGLYLLMADLNSLKDAEKTVRLHEEIAARAPKPAQQAPASPPTGGKSPANLTATRAIDRPKQPEQTKNETDRYKHMTDDLVKMIDGLQGQDRKEALSLDKYENKERKTEFEAIKNKFSSGGDPIVMSGLVNQMNRIKILISQTEAKVAENSALLSDKMKNVSAKLNVLEEARKNNPLKQLEGADKEWEQHYMKVKGEVEALIADKDQAIKEINQAKAILKKLDEISVYIASNGGQPAKSAS